MNTINGTSASSAGNEEKDSNEVIQNSSQGTSARSSVGTRDSTSRDSTAINNNRKSRSSVTSGAVGTSGGVIAGVGHAGPGRESFVQELLSVLENNTASSNGGGRSATPGMSEHSLLVCHVLTTLTGKTAAPTPHYPPTSCQQQ